MLLESLLTYFLSFLLRQYHSHAPLRGCPLQEKLLSSFGIWERRLRSVDTNALHSETVRLEINPRRIAEEEGKQKTWKN